MKGKFIILTIFFLSTFIFIINLYGFCVYNNTDTKIRVVEVEGGKSWKSFTQTLNPGEKKCCNWKNRDCNVEGKRDSKIDFHVQGAIGGSKSPDWDMCFISIKAGGDLIVEGRKNDYYRCIAKDY